MAFKRNDSCLAKVGDDELIFVLRAQDRTSPQIILEWIKQNFETVEEDKLVEAFHCALNMRAFKGRRQAT